MYQEVHLQSKIGFSCVCFNRRYTINTDLNQSADEDAIYICILALVWVKYFRYLNSEYKLQANICF